PSGSHHRAHQAEGRNAPADLTLKLNLKRDNLTIDPTKRAGDALRSAAQLCWTVPVPPTHRPEKPRPPHEPGTFLVTYRSRDCDRARAQPAPSTIRMSRSAPSPSTLS